MTKFVKDDFVYVKSSGQKGVVRSVDNQGAYEVRVAQLMEKGNVVYEFIGFSEAELEFPKEAVLREFEEKKEFQKLLKEYEREEMGSPAGAAASSVN